MTGANPHLVSYRNSEELTTKDKIVDTQKAVRDLAHRDTVSLEEGIGRTAEWMRQVYGLDNKNPLRKAA